MTGDFIKQALRKKHQPPWEWIFVTEVRTTTGSSDGRSLNHGNEGLRIIDAFAMNMYPSTGFRRIAYEIKVSRADLQRELAEPTKRSQALFLSDEFYFVLPEAEYNRIDIPWDAYAECGLMIVRDSGSIKTIHGPTSAIYQNKRHKGNMGAWPMPIWFVASLLRRVRDQNGGGAVSDED